MTKRQRAFIREHASLALVIFRELKDEDPFGFPPSPVHWFWAVFREVKAAPQLFTRM